MADPNGYEQKIKDMQKYIPFLESLIKKMKNNKDEKRESHLNKVEMLYGLLTNKDKKLKLETLQKCEAVLVKLCEKIEKSDGPQPGLSKIPSANDAEDGFLNNPDDETAPASPSNQEPNYTLHNPIVIPTERRQTPPPPRGSMYPLGGSGIGGSGHRSTYEDDKLFDRSRHHRGSGPGGGGDHTRREGSGHQTPSLGGKCSPELFRRRSPNRDRPNRFDEELWKKYESPPPPPSGSIYSAQSSSNYSGNHYPTTSRPRVQVRSSFASAEVLKSPPLTLDDLKDLMEVSDIQQSNAPIPHHTTPFPPQPVPPPVQHIPINPPLPILAPPPQLPRPVTPPAPVPPPRIDPRFDQKKDPRMDPRADPRNIPRNTGNVAEQMSNMRMDPRNRIDPRLNREPILTKPLSLDSTMPDHTDPKPVEPPVRLAYKYNPHPRRETPIAKQNDFADMHSKMDDGRGINHLPSVNPSDPRLRNRQLNLFAPECPPTPMSHMNSPIGNISSPISNSPLSPMANFMDPKLPHSMGDNHNSPIYGNNPQFFGKFQPHLPQVMMQSQQLFMNSPGANPFKQPHSTPQATPRTYGEYRKFKQTFEQKHKRPQQNMADSKKNSPYHGQSPLEATVKPMEFTKEPAPSVLDTMYRNTNFKPEAPSTGAVQSFKIPKLNKSQPAAAQGANNNKANNKQLFDSQKNTNQSQAQKPNESKEDNWDDGDNWDDDANQTTNTSTSQKQPEKDDKSDENWDDDDAVVNTPAEISKNQQESKRYSDGEDWDEPKSPPRKSTPPPPSLPKKTQSKGTKSKKQYKRYSDDEDWELSDSAPKKTAKANKSQDKYESDISSDEGNDFGDDREYDSLSSDGSTTSKGKKEAATQGKKDAKATPASSKKSVGKKTPATAKASEAKADSSHKSDTMEVDENDTATAEETASEQSAAAKNQKKRKSQSAPEKPLPEKVPKTDEKQNVDEEVDKTEASTTSAAKETETPDKEKDEDGDSEGELPDTIINSDISMKNIIEGGRRRTRISNPNYPGFEIGTPAKSKTPSVSPPKKGKQKTPVKAVDEASQECAVSSTTTIAEPQPEEEPQEEAQPAKTAPRGKGKKGAAAKKGAKKEPSVAKETSEEPKDKPAASTTEANAPPATASTSTATKEKDEITKEWLESFLLNLFNPTQMSTTSVLAMLEKVLDTTKFQQVKQILCNENTSTESKPEAPSTPEPQPVESAAGAKADAPKTAAAKPKKKKNELDRLNEDIRDMFICQGVLTATGRRMCSAISEKEHELQIGTDKEDEPANTPSTSSTVKGQSKGAAKKTAKAAASTAAKAAAAAAAKKKIRRGGVFWRGNKNSKKKKKGRGRPRKPTTDDEAAEDEDSRDDFHVAGDDDNYDDEQHEEDNDHDENKSDRNETEEGEEVLKIVVGEENSEKPATKKNEESIEILDSSTEDADVVESEKLQSINKQPKSGILIVDKEDLAGNINTSPGAPKLDAQINFEASGSPEKQEAPKLEPIVLIKRKRGRPTKPDENPTTNQTDTQTSHSTTSIKNINPEMHSQSKYASTCGICNNVVRHIANHYINAHPESEVLVSRLPPNTQARLLEQNGAGPVNSIRKEGKVTYEYVCPFCEVINSFPRSGWIEHFGRHTGEYAYKCTTCNRYFNMMWEGKRHIATKCINGQIIRVRSSMEGKQVSAFLCTLCNYIQMSLERVQSHLRTQHDVEDDNFIKEIILLKWSGKSAKQEKSHGNDVPPPASNESEMTDAEKNREVFVTNEQNDINLDTNIIQFMRDVSFSATGSPPRQATMSVADRINEKLKNVSSQSHSDVSESDSSFLSTPQKSKSMVDRLTERFNRTSPPNVVPDAPEKVVPDSEPPKIDEGSVESVPEKPASPLLEEPQDKQSIDAPKCEISDKIEPGINLAAEDAKKQDSDDDVIIISDCEDDSKSAKQQNDAKEEPPKNDDKQETTEVKAPDASEVTEILDDDDDWEDIETPPSPSCLDSESKGLPADSKMKKNKTIYATLSRLYASIVQPKAKGKPGETSDKESSENVNNEKLKVGTVDRKKLDVSGMLRVDTLGYIRTIPDTLKYHCLVDGCSFLYSDFVEGLKTHINEHSTLAWSGFCHICKGNVKVAENLKLTDELEHLQEVHVKCPKRPADIPVETLRSSPATASVIKLRRLSGDQLSQNLSQVEKSSPPPLQITSAISLNKDSDIWKPVVSSPEKQTSGILLIKQVSIGSPASSPTIATSNLKIASVTSIAKPGAPPTTSLLSQPLAKIMQVALDSSQNTILKPWLKDVSRKSDTINKTLLQDANLYSKYKCMGYDCDYATNCLEQFMTHLRYHLNNDKDLIYRDMYLLCCYCDKWTPSIEALKAHHQDDHFNDIFQCPYCLYRSCEATNVLTHLDLYHSECKKNILRCIGEPRDSFKEYQKIQTYIVRHIEPIRCADCPTKFISPSAFAEHLNKHTLLENYFGYKCAHCKPRQDMVNKNCAQLHLEAEHKISYFACVYCKYGVGGTKEIMEHLANQHPNKLMFACIRSDKLNAKMQEKFYAEVMPNIMVVLLSENVDPSLITKCPYSNSELNSFSLQWVANTIKTPSTTPPVTKKLIPTSQEPSIDSPPEKSPLPTESANITPPSSSIDGASTSPDTNVDSFSSDPSNVDRNTQILNAAMDITGKTGVRPSELYKCGAANCNFNGHAKFKLHLTVQHTQPFKCFHCDKLFKTPTECFNHYAQHEQHRYFCFLCFSTSRSAAALAAHISRAHSMKGKSTIITYALIKGSVNPKDDFFFVCPNSVKAVDVIGFGDRLLKMWERKKWANMKKSFTPDEIEQLPRQAIFFDELYCATCQYRTKVRTNLYRHLQFHKNEVNVASIDPVNPVPCLNSREKHFDKMTNLACSSHANKPPPPATNGPGTTGGTPLPSLSSDVTISDSGLRRVEHVIPDYVASQNRFTCNVGECKFITGAEIMYKQHINSVHPNEQNFSCPHCHVLICNSKICADKVVHHMKFHDTNLFQCKRCGYLHFHKPVMERHIAGMHPNENVTYLIYTRKEDEVKRSSSEVLAKMPAPTMKWQCTLCKTQTATQGQMTAHLTSKHQVKYKFQCSKCNFGGLMVSAISDHAQRKHPNSVTEVICFYTKIDEISNAAAKTADTTPLWRRDPDKVKNIRGILMEEESASPVAMATTDTTFDDDDDIIEMDESVSDDVETIETANSRRITPVCRVCSYSTSDLPTLHAHIAGNHVDEPEHKDILNILFKFVCFHCGKDCKTLIAFKFHWEKCHKIPPSASAADTNETRDGQSPWFTVTRRLKCSKCYTTNDYRELAIHHFLEHPTEHFATRDLLNENKCGHCDFTFEKIAELDEHYLAEHSPHTTDSNKWPVPDAPYTPLTAEYVRQLAPQNHVLQFFKCNICNLVLHDMISWNFHCERQHGVKENMPCTVLQGMMYKCPTCKFCSPLEANILKHISNKLSNGNFDAHEKILKPPGVSEKEWPFTTLQVIFPNGFVIEKFRLLGTQYGNMAKIAEHVRKAEPVVLFEMTVPAGMRLPKTTASNESPSKPQDSSIAIVDSSDSSKDDSQDSQANKQRVKRSASGGSQGEDSEDEETAAKPKKKFKPTENTSSETEIKNDSIADSSENKLSPPQEAMDEKTIKNADDTIKNEKNDPSVNSTDRIESKPTEDTSSNKITKEENNNPETTDPAPSSSSHDNTSANPSLENITANVTVDGVKVKIPAKDFHKVFKKQLTLKLQRISADSQSRPTTPTTRSNQTALKSMNDDEKATSSTDAKSSKKKDGQ